MSQTSSDTGNSRSGGQRRSSGRQRSRNNRGGSRNRNRGGQRGGNRSPQGRRSVPSTSPRRPQPAPLSFWQKILKAVGLYDPGKPPKRTSPSRVQKPPVKGNAPKTGDSKPKQERKTRTRNARTVQKPVDSNRLYVGNLSFDATEADLGELFKGAGTVDNVEIVYNRNTHRSKGYAFVEMGSVDEAKRAVDTLHDQQFMERQLIVSGAKSKGPAKGDAPKDGAPKGGAPKESAPVVSDIKPPEEDLVDERLKDNEPREII